MATVFRRVIRDIYSWIVFLMVATFSCQSPKQFDNFDSAAWKSDRLGCQGKRNAMRAELDQIRQQLKGLTQEQILEVLGKPDFQKLYQRNQKFYVYFIEPGPQCRGKANDSQGRTIVIRFSAIELATEVYYASGKPE